jgi:glycosyltransferase involved in cell wall biosynthesis
MASDLPLSISVAMATYNGARFITDQLNSIASQTLLPYELVITDDGSSDDTCAIIREFAKTSLFPVHLYHNEERLGYRDNFIKAAYLCKGDLVAFCDQDDIWCNNKLKMQQKYFNDPRVAMVTHPYQVIDTDGRITNTVFPKIKRVKRHPPLGFNMFFTYYGMTLIFRKAMLPSPECINKRPIDYCTFENSMAHDQWIPFLATSRHAIIFLPNALTLYRRHNDNTCGPQPKVSFPSRLMKLAFPRSPEKDSELYRNLSLSLVSRVTALTSGCGPRNLASPEDIDSAIDFYNGLSVKYRLRADMYDSSLTRLEKSSLFLKALLSGAYGKKQKGLFGAPGAVKDLINICSIRMIR